MFVRYVGFIPSHSIIHIKQLRITSAKNNLTIWAGFKWMKGDLCWLWGEMELNGVQRAQLEQERVGGRWFRGWETGVRGVGGFIVW